MKLPLLPPPPQAARATTAATHRAFIRSHFRPATGALSLIFVIGTFAVFFGILQVSFALRLRRHASAMS